MSAIWLRWPCSRERHNCVIDAVGPETFTYPEASVPPGLGYAAGWVIGKLVGDVMITKEEIAGLNGNLLMTDAPAAGPTKLTEWVAGHAATLGLRYISELARRLDRREAYQTN